MSSLSSTPGKMKALLVICLVCILTFMGIDFYAYKISRDSAEAAGKDTVPSIIAAQNIKASLANAHSNAMNAMVTKEKSKGRFWSQYRSDMDSLHSQLVYASRDISYGDAERIPLTTISSNISAYEYTVGGSVANGAQISVDQFMEANRLMQQKILPASTALNKVNQSKLDSIYNSYSKSVDTFITILVISGILIIILLLWVKIYFFKKTHRIFNAGLLTAMILFCGSMIFSVNSLKSVKNDIFSAKNDAFKSIDALYSAKSAAYNAKSIESLYLLHQGTGIVQTADTINFDLSASRIVSDTKSAAANSSFEGYLNDALRNITFEGEKAAVDTALAQWLRYVDIDKNVHSLEYDSRHDEAVKLSTGGSKGQADYEFSKFDTALKNAIDINQENFTAKINSAYSVLNRFPFIMLGFLIIICAGCIFGIKLRLDEYRV